MLRRIAVLSLAYAVLLSPAFANEDFCGDAESCKEMSVFNRSAALVTSVTITQEKTNGDCVIDKRTFSKNLNGVGGESMDGDGFTIQANSTCKYKIKYKTTSGCTGDKTGHFTPKGISTNKNYAELTGACGSLKVKVR